MKWKDTGETMANEEIPEKEEYFDEEQYSPWADRKQQKKGGALKKVPVLFGLLLLAIAALGIVLLMLVINGSDGPVSSQRLASMEQRLQKLEQRLDNFEAIDEKVTRIWEQAKSFEKFKDRFDRSEASMTLRMDHMTMSLETLQKQVNDKHSAAASIPPPAEGNAQAPAIKIKYHQVQAGETLYSISKQYNLKVEQLLKMNKMEPGSILQTGQKLIVSGPSDK